MAVIFSAVNAVRAAAYFKLFSANLSYLRVFNKLNNFLGLCLYLFGRALHHPAAAAGDYLVVCKILKDVVGRDAAGGHYLKIGECRADGLYRLKSAVVGCGEELEGGKALCNGSHCLGGGNYAGQVEHFVLRAAVGNFGREAGGNDELRACNYRLLALVLVYNRARADERLGEVVCGKFDGLGRALGAEGDLRAGQAALNERRHLGHNLVDRVENYDGYHFCLSYFFKHLLFCHDITSVYTDFFMYFKFRRSLFAARGGGGVIFTAPVHSVF